MFCIGVVSDSISEQLVFKYSVSLYVWTRRIFQIHTIFIYAHAVEWVHSKKSSAYSGHSREKNKADIDGICFLILFTKNKFRTALGNEWESPPPKKRRKPFLSQQDNVKPHSRITTAWLCSKEVWVLCSYLLLPTENFLCHMKHQVRMGETLGYRTYMSRGFPTALLKVVMNMPALQLEHVPAFVLLASKT